LPELLAPCLGQHRKVFPGSEKFNRDTNLLRKESIIVFMKLSEPLGDLVLR
jgi:hypothetical protein